MTDDDVRLVCKREIDAAESHVSQLAAERTIALDYYLGKNRWASKPNESSVVTRETLETVEWIHPQLLKVFASSDDVVRFEPQGPEDEQAAEQATDFANWIWNRDNNGFLNIHTWTKDALLSRLGVVKSWWEDEPKVTVERLAGLSIEQLTLLMQDEQLELTAAERSSMPGPVGPDGAAAALYDVELTRSVPDGRVRIMAIPPEEYLFLPSCKTDEDPGQGHKRTLTQSELLDMGYSFDQVDALPTADEDDDNAERSNRMQPAARQEINRDSRDRASRLIEIVEWYTLLDANGDGRTEFMKVTLAGTNHSVLLDRVEVDCAPFACLSPVLMPHRKDGLSIPDLVRDLQEIKTSIMRQTLNSLYQANKPRHALLDGQVNIQDYLGTGSVRVKSLGAIMPIETQFVGGASMPMLDYIDRVLEGRSGVSKLAQGIDADVLKGGAAAAQTATGVAALQAAAALRVELIARVFAETGLKRAFRLILKLITRYQQSARVIRLRNEWVPMDPRSWDADMDLTTEVGLGTGNKLEQMNYLTQVLALQKELLAQGGLGLVEPKHIYATSAKLTQLAGFKSVDAYFNDPVANPPPAPPPPPPDPNMLAVQMQGQIEQAKLQLQAEKDRRADDRERDKMDMEFALKTAELQARYGAQINVAQVRGQVDRDRELIRQQGQLAQQQMNGPAQQPGPIPQQMPPGMVQ